VNGGNTSARALCGGLNVVFPFFCGGLNVVQKQIFIVQVIKRGETVL
jgi:hypothetical protein